MQVEIPEIATEQSKQCSDVKNLESLQQIFKGLVDNCIQQTDWNNKEQAYQRKKLLFQSILSTIKQFMRSFGCPQGFYDKYFPNKPEQRNEIHPHQRDFQKNGVTDDVEGGMSNQNTSTSTQDNSGETKLVKEENFMNPNKNQQEKSLMIVDKSQLNEEPQYCQKVVINAHPFKQRLNNEKERAAAAAKSRKQDSDHYSTEDSDSDFNESDEDYSGDSGRRKKRVLKQKQQIPQNYKFQSDRPKQRGRPPNPEVLAAGIISVFDAPEIEQQKVLEQFLQEYDPSKRNKMQIINQLVTEKKFSFSSIYQLVNKQDNQKEHKSKVYTNNDNKPQRQINAYFKQKAQQQKMEYYNQVHNQFNLYDDDYTDYKQQGTHLQQHLQAQNRSQYLDQMNNSMRQQRPISNDKYPLNKTLQSQYQGYNSQMYRQSNNSYQTPFQPSKLLYQAQEYSQSDSDSGSLFKINPNQIQNIFPNLDQSHFNNNDVSKLQQGQYQPKQNSSVYNGFDFTGIQPQKNINYYGQSGYHGYNDHHLNITRETMKLEF